MNLYEIKKEYIDILSNPDYVDMETWEITEAWEQALNENQENLSTKLDNIARFIRSLEAESDAYKKESDRLLALKKSADNKAKSLKKYLESALEWNPLNTELFKFSFRKSESAKLEDDTKVPQEWKTHIPESWATNLTEIKKKLNNEVKVRVQEAKDDGREYNEQEIKEELYSQYWLSISFNQNLQIK
jgi:hypothetical protein